MKKSRWQHGILWFRMLSNGWCPHRDWLTGRGRLIRPGLNAGSVERKAIRWISDRWVVEAGAADNTEDPSQTSCQNGETADNRQEGNGGGETAINTTARPSRLWWHVSNNVHLCFGVLQSRVEYPLKTHNTVVDWLGAGDVTPYNRNFNGNGRPPSCHCS